MTMTELRDFEFVERYLAKLFGRWKRLHRKWLALDPGYYAEERREYEHRMQAIESVASLMCNFYR